jgi:uncharacterized membrane protein
MNKKEFLKQLKHQLNGIKEDDQEDILEDYEEHFEEAIKEGKSEEEISKDLGNPKDIAKELRAYSVIEKAEKNLNFKNMVEVISTFLSLGIFNLILIFPYLITVIALFGLGILAIAGVLGGLVGLVVLIFSFISQPTLVNSTFTTFLLSLIAIGGGCLLGILDFFAIKSFYKFTIRYIKMNVKLVKDKD